MEANDHTHRKREKNNPLLPFLAALRFLTVIPIAYRAEHDSDHFTASIYYFPVIGLLIGLVGAACTVVCSIFLPTQVTAFLLIALLAAMSGFLHLDGLADSGDGLMSARPAKAALAIMRDSRSGAMGVVVLILVLVGKYSALSSLSPQHLLVAAILMPLAGRVAILTTMATQPYAREGGGLGNLFYSPASKRAALIGLALLLGTASVFLQLYATVICLVVICTILLFAKFCRHKIGGVTGDTLGAVCELSEMSVALAISVI